MNTRLWVTVLVGLFIIGGLFTLPAGSQSTPETAANVSPTVDDALTDAGGDQTVIVRLAEPDEPTLRATGHENRVDAMKTHAAASQSAFERFANGNPHVEIDRQFWLTNALVVTVDTDRVPLEQLGTVENVERIHENHRVSVTGRSVDQVMTDGGAVLPETSPERGTDSFQPSPTPTLSTTATESGYTRALEVINIPSAFERGNRGDGVRVAVLDTGVNPDHPDIAISDDDWVCYVDCFTDGPHDVDGHGTHVSGTAVGGNANDVGLQIGVAPNATLMHAKVLDDAGSGNFNNVIDGMEWAVENDADVMAMSLGTEGYFDAFIQPVRNAQSSGTVVVAAIGNDGHETSESPGNVYDATAVGSVNVEPAFPEQWNFGLTDDTVSSFSGGEQIQRSDWTNPPSGWPESYVVPDVTAPGSVIWSADTNLDTATDCGSSAPPTNDLACQQGTSMAAPHVAGTVALMLSNSNVDRSPSEIHAALTTTAVDIGDDETRQGAGRINADAAVAAVETHPNLTVTTMSTPNRLTAGRLLTADYTVENVGTETGTEEIQFLINETVVETAEIGPLDPGDQHSGTFSYQTTANDTGSLTVSIASDDTTRSQIVDIVAPEVRLTDITITPDTFSGTTSTHTLSFTVMNVSDDGQADEFTITLPESVSVDNVDSVTATTTDGESITAEEISTTETDLTFTVSPDTEAELRDLDLLVEFSAQAK